MPDTTQTPDPVVTYLTGVRKNWEVWGDGNATPDLLDALEALLGQHKIEPLFAHSDNGECGCPPPTEYTDLCYDCAYDDDHPEGLGPDGEGIVCRKKIVGHWCRGCADVAMDHGCFETPKAYPAEKCPVRSVIAAKLPGAQ